MRSFFANNKKFLLVFVVLMLCLVGLSSCGSKYGQKTLYMQENSSSGCAGNANAKSKTEWFKELIDKDTDASKTADENLDIQKGHLEELFNTYIIEKAVANTDDQTKIDNNFQVALIRNDIVEFKGYLNNITAFDFEAFEASSVKTSFNGAAGCLDVNTERKTREALSKASETTNGYELGALFILKVESRFTELEPIKFKASSVGEFFANFWNNIFIFPIAGVLYFISRICGGYYVIGLLITTILVRTLGWPIYAKTNDLSMKMGAIQPEIQKIQEKYAGKNDPESQRRMQLEQAQLYKKHKIGIGGCFAPILQFPIFMAIFRAISRIPYTKAIPGTIYNLNWASELKPTLFGVNLFEDRNVGGTAQLVGVIVLLLLVVGTQILSQVLTQNRQKQAQVKAQENIPQYRRQAYNQTQNQTQSSMKMMLWFMILMMGMFVWTSKAGLGFYWLIGNIYSMVQMVINNATSEKRLEKFNQKNGIYTVKK